MLWPRPLSAGTDPRAGLPADLPASNLVQAAIAYLRANPSLAGLFGEPTLIKFHTDLVPVNTTLPWIAFDEGEEADTYESDGTYTSEGLLTVLVTASVKRSARLLAEAVYRLLEDAPLYFTDGELIYLRRTRRRFDAITEQGPGNTVLYKRPLEFRYIIERKK